MSKFDPYREWLGIQSHHKPTYYQLLGVSPTEEDPAEIRRCAQRRLRQLASVNDPAREEIKDALRQRIWRAARCLMQVEQRVAYDRKLIALRDGSTATAAPLDAPHPDVREPREAVAIQVGHRSPPSVSKKYKSQQRLSRAFTLYGLLGLVSVCGIGFLVATQTSAGRAVLGLDGNRLAANASQHSSSGVRTANNSLSQETLVRDALPVRKETSVRAEETENGTADSDVSTPPGDTSENTRSALSLADPTSPTPEEIRQLENALRSARAALETRDTQHARATLASVAELNKMPKHQAMYARLDSLAYLVEQYWQALDESLDRLQSGTELVVGGERMMVVECDPQQIVLRHAGVNKTLQRDQLPFSLEVALADRWFAANKASSKVFRGAMMAVSEQFKDAQVRELWRQAKAEGAELKDLELVLDDDYDLSNTLNAQPSQPRSPQP